MRSISKTNNECPDSTKISGFLDSDKRGKKKKNNDNSLGGSTCTLAGNSTDIPNVGMTDLAATGSGPVDEMTISTYNTSGSTGGITDSIANMSGLTYVLTEPTANTSGLDSLAGKKTFTAEIPKVVLLKGLKVVRGAEESVLAAPPSSYDTKLSPMSLTKANLRKLDVNVPNDVDCLIYQSWNSLYATIGKNMDSRKYMKETIRVEYEWEPPSCSACLIFGHLLDDGPKAPKRVVNRMDKRKGGSSGANDECFIEVKKKKSSHNKEATKNSNRSW
ncbi:hypothetical protein Tco_1197068 [Tanacetum coccineum]